MNELKLPPGPLKVCRDNPRYFATPDGQPVYLTGSHTWACLHERLLDETPVFDYSAWLDMMSRNGQNFLRLWAWEQAAWMQFTSRKVKYGPNRYRRTGPGKALDGGPRFDLSEFNDDFFDRFRFRVLAAGKRGIYVGVMLFQGFSVDKRKVDAVDEGQNAFNGHPMNRKNNINDIDGDLDASGTGHQVHTLEIAEVTRLQEKFVKKVIDTLSDLDHILWEISNESHRDSVNWQYHMIDVIHDYEKGKSKQHPVGMTGAPIQNPELFASPADWISPRGREYITDPPPGDGSKVVVHDTDHSHPFNHEPETPWRSFLRGLNFISMDPYMDCRIDSPAEPAPEFEDIRRQTGYTLQLARRLNLKAVSPLGELASTGYCLANPGQEYLVYLPDGGTATVDLSDVRGALHAEWFNPSTGETLPSETVNVVDHQVFHAPFDGHAELHLKAVSELK